MIRRCRTILSSNGACNAQLPISTTSRSVQYGCKISHRQTQATFSTRANRRTVTKEERSALRAARKQLVAKSAQSQKATEASSSSASVASGAATGKKPWDARVVFGLGLGLPTFMIGWGIYDETSPPAKFARMIGLADKIESFADDFNRPSRPKLIPDWEHLPNIPQGMAAPPTLVLDLENTLVNSTWDRKYGWRHAKRPGVEKFLRELAQYYEIVLYSPSIEGIADPVVTLLDKSGCFMHRLYRDACYYKDGVYMKDLSALNRNINKIILIDDDPNAAKLNPRNHIRIKPYDDATDRKDNSLERITPFLIEIATEGYDDVPHLLSQFDEDMDSDDIADELERRVEDLKSIRMQKSQRGLGAFSNLGQADRMEPEMTPVPERERIRRQEAQQQITSKDLVGSAPATSGGEKKAGFSGWLQKRQVEQQEEQQRKLEKWNEVMMKKQMEKKNSA